MKIGVFDSGIGGITLLKQLLKLNPFLEYYYLGDNKYCPYGEKTEEQVKERILKIKKFLKKNGCQRILIACNTASIIAEKYDLLNKDMIGISQIIKDELKLIDNFVIYGTEITINSKYYEIEKKEQISIASKKLATLIENEYGDTNTNILKCLKNDLKNIDNRYNKLVLCCTHYPIVSDEIRKILNFEIEDFTEVISRKLIQNISNKQKEPEQKIFFTGSVETYNKIFFKYLKRNASIVNIEGVLNVDF